MSQRHIHDCTGPEQRCVCGYVSPHADPVHSPGPWQALEWGRASDDCILDANGEHIVCCGHDYNEGGIIANDADKRLIAAAPDLLAALKAMRDGAYGCPWEPEETKRIDEMADAAIAKAEGRA